MAQSLDQTNVFVKYLPSELDDEGLRELFAPYGDIISSKVMVDHQTGSSLGYGFVRFASQEETQQAILKMSGQRVHNKVLLCKLSNSSPNSITPEPSTNLYIKPLLQTTREDDLRELFTVFGPIAAAKVMVDKTTGESRQIGFVRFENQEDATAALNAMNGFKIEEDQPALIVKYAETEHQRTVRKSRAQTTPFSPSPHSPPSPTYSYEYYHPQMTMFSPMAYVPVQAKNYMNYPHPYSYMTMMPFSPPHSSHYGPVWRPPYVLAAEQMTSY